MLEACDTSKRLSRAIVYGRYELLRSGREIPVEVVYLLLTVLLSQLRVDHIVHQVEVLLVDSLANIDFVRGK